MDYIKLLPALLKGANGVDEKIHEAIRYLEHCVFRNGINNRALNNHIISLYCQTKQEAKLIKFLSLEHELEFELHYALKTAIEHGLNEATVILYSKLEMYNEAVDLSLKMDDIELAKIYANKVDFDEHLCKKLWQKIAKYVIEKKMDVGE